MQGEPRKGELKKKSEDIKVKVEGDEDKEEKESEELEGGEEGKRKEEIKWEKRRL